MIGFFIAIISGMLMSLQGVFNTAVTRETGLWLSNSWVQLTALGVCVIGWMVTGRTHIGTLWQVQPKYLLLGGVIGAFITLTVIKSMELMGPAKAVLFIVIAQTAFAYIIEVLGLFGTEKVDFSMQKLMGILIAIGGLIVFQWERKSF